MKALKSKGTLASFEGKLDEVGKHEAGILLKVRSRIAGQVVPGGHVLTKGDQELVMLSRDVAAFLGSVDPTFDDTIERGRVYTDELEEERIAEAGKRYFRLLEDAVAASMGTVTAAQVESVRKGTATSDTGLSEGDIRDIAARLTKIQNQDGLSMEGAFFKEFRRGIRPIESVEVLDLGVVLDDTKDDAFGRAALIAEAIKVMQTMGDSGGGLGMVQGITQEQLDARLKAQEDALRAEFRQVLEELTADAPSDSKPSDSKPSAAKEKPASGKK